jgi:tetratricopeptide (TPR) repeat protein
MSPIPTRLAIPTNDDDFETLCRDLLRAHWSAPRMEIFGKRGERQFGIDVLDLSGQEPLYAAQAKLKEPHKSLPPQDIQDEVDLAKQFDPPLGKYGILTSGKVSTQSQRKVREINALHRAQGLFEVELFTWEKISELVQKYPEVYEDHYGEIAVGRGVRIESAVIGVQRSLDSLEAKVEGDHIDTLINEARDAVNEHNYQMATLLLNRIEKQNGHKLTLFQRFRVLSNHGFAALGQQKTPLAAKYFLEALSVEPTNEKARANEVLAYYVTGDLRTAFEKAESLREVYPSSTQLATHWILSSPPEKRTSDLELELSSILLAEGQVRTALAYKALAEHDLDRAEGHAKLATSNDPTHGQPHLVLARIGIARVVDLVRGAATTSKTKSELLAKIESDARLAINLASKQNDVTTQLESYEQLIDTKLMQGDVSGAADELAEAVKLAPDTLRVLLAQAHVQMEKDQFEDAIKTLEGAYAFDQRADIAFSYSNALLATNKDSNVELAVEVLTGIDMATVNPQMRNTLTFTTVRAGVKVQRWERVRDYLVAIEPHVAPESVETLRAFASHSEGDKQDAEAAASKSLGLLSSSSTFELKIFLGRLLMTMGRLTDALPLLQEAFDANVPSFDYTLLLDCAARLNREGVIIDAFRKLRARGIEDWQTVEFGIQFLQKYQPREAAIVLKEFLEKNPGHKLATLSLSILGLITNQPELVSGNIDDLPPVEELPLEYVVQAVQVLRSADNADPAVAYAYEYLRHHFKEARAHRAFILTMSPFDPSPNIRVSFDAVEIETAVRFEELPTGDPEWVVIVENPSPSDELKQMASDSRLAKELLGKKVDETFQLAPGFVERRGTIRQIIHKYVYQYNDCGERWQRRFPDEPMIESVRLGANQEEVQESIKKIFEAFQKRADTEVEMRRMYNSVPTPLHIFGTWHGKNAYVGLILLAAEEGQNVPVNYGTAEERSEALAALQATASLIVDLSVLATLRLLKLENVLKTKRFRFAITDNTLRTLRETLARADNENSPAIGVQFVDGKVVGREETVEAKRERNQSDRDFLALIEEHCEIVPAEELAFIEASQRERLEKGFGLYGVEAMLLGSKTDTLLWTDDFVQAQIAAIEFGTKRVWTQLVITLLAESGLLSPKERDVAAAKLVYMSYSYTSYDVASIIEAVELSDGKPWDGPLKSFVQQFGAVDANLAVQFPILVGFIQRLYREGILPETRCAVITAFLNALWTNVAARRTILHLRATTARIFDLNYVGMKQFEDCFDSWYGKLNWPLILSE